MQGILPSDEAAAKEALEQFLFWVQKEDRWRCPYDWCSVLRKLRTPTDEHVRLSLSTESTIIFLTRLFATFGHVSSSLTWYIFLSRLLIEHDQIHQ